MVSDQSTGHKAGLVTMNLGNCPRANPAVNQVSVHFAIRIHRRDRSVVGNKGRIAFLIEEAEVSQLKITTVRTVQAYLVGQRCKNVPEIGDTDIRTTQ